MGNPMGSKFFLQIESPLLGGSWDVSLRCPRKQGVRRSDAYARAAGGVCGGGARDFLADSRRWGKMGHTRIRLAASEDILTGALRTAWRLRIDKKNPMWRSAAE